MFTQKIYVNNKPLVLTTDAKTYMQDNAMATGYLQFTGAFTRNFRLALQHLEKPGTLGAIIEDISPNSLQQSLYELYEPIDAAGGVVENENGAVLMIYRRGKWDLPKGKRDEGEDMATCALREVSEETGLTKLKLAEKIGNTYHVYSQGGQNLLKCTAWYKMKGSVKDTLVPQKEENIIEAKWVDATEMKMIVYKSYEAIREVLILAGLKW